MKINWLKSRYCFHPPSASVAMLIKHGYRQISRKERTLACIDITPHEISEFFKNKKIRVNTAEGKMEYYRREYSKDRIILVPEPIMILLRKREKVAV